MNGDMKLRLEKQTLRLGEDTEFPEFSFNHAYNGLGNDKVDVYFLVPSTKEDAIKTQATEIAAHLLGEYS